MAGKYQPLHGGANIVEIPEEGNCDKSGNGQCRTNNRLFAPRLLLHGLHFTLILGELAHLGVARGNALRAKTSQGADADAARVRALAAYKDFLTLWKDADPDIPILKQAKAEYARLQ